MNWKIVIKITLIFLLLHTFYCVFVFAFVHTHPDAQDVLYWLMFFGPFDEPFVSIGYLFDGLVFNFTGILTDFWYKLGYSGLNMRSGLIHLIFGGLQWTVVGALIGTLIATIIQWRRSQLPIKLVGLRIASVIIIFSVVFGISKYIDHLFFERQVTKDLEYGLVNEAAEYLIGLKNSSQLSEFCPNDHGKLKAKEININNGRQPYPATVVFQSIKDKEPNTVHYFQLSKKKQQAHWEIEKQWKSKK